MTDSNTVKNQILNKTSTDTFFSDFYLKYREYIIIIISYFLAHFLLLLDDSIFWDDWLLINLPTNLMVQQWADSGRPIVGLIIKLMRYSENVMYLSKILTFLLFLFSGILLFKILKRINLFSKQESLLLTVFFVTFPLNFARLTLACFQYSLFYFLFFAGFYFVTLFFLKNNVFYRIIGLSLILISFTTESLITFYVVVIFFILYKDIHSFKKIYLLNTLKIFLKYFDFFVLPFLFLAISKYIFSVSNAYKSTNYNSIQINKILTSPIDYVYILQQSFFETIYASIKIGFATVVPTSLFFLLFAKFFNNVQFNDGRNLSIFNSKHPGFKLFVFCSVIISFLSAFPYIVVNKLPLPSDFTSRHQLLMPLGFSLFIMLILKQFGKSRSKNTLSLLVSFFIGVFIMYNISRYMDFKKEWLAQTSLISHIKKSKIFAEHSTFLFKDESNLNVDNRDRRFYEYAGFFNSIFKGQSRIGFDSRINNQEFIDQIQLSQSHPYNNISNYKLQNPEYLIVIKQGSYKLDNFSIFKLLVQYWFKPLTFYSNIDKIIELSIVKI